MTQRQARQEVAVMIMKTFNTAVKTEDEDAIIAVFEAKTQLDEGHVLTALRTVKPHALRLIDGL